MWRERMMDWGWDGWVGAWPLHVLGLALLVAAVIVLFRRHGAAGMRHHRVREDRAVAILRERYAHGEISQPEFEEQMRRLRQSR